MKTTMQVRASEQLIEARRCVDRWRRERTSRKETIPDHVWGAAAEAARVDGVWATSRALRLEFNRLKERVLATTSGKAIAGGRRAGAVERRLAPKAAAAATFVEVALEPRPETGAAGKAVIELTGRHGDRLRIEVAGPTVVDVVGLSQTFWSQRP